MTGSQRLRFDGTNSTIEAFKDSISHPHKFCLSKKAMCHHAKRKKERKKATCQAYFKLEEKIDCSFKLYTELEDLPMDPKFIRSIFNPGGHLWNLRSSFLRAGENDAG